MKVSPINPSFRGQYVYNYNESTLKSHPQWQKNSSVEDTLGSYHSRKTNMAYFADPMEPISDKIKEKADFIVYDNEPAYPDIDEVSTNYFGTLRKNFRETFEEVRNYFYRREMGGFANVEEAKEKQREAAECTRMYDAAGDLRYKKETTEDEIRNLEAQKAGLTKSLATTEKELMNDLATKAHIEKHTENLTKLKKPYQKLITIAKESSPNEAALFYAVGDTIRVIPYGIEHQAENNKKQLSGLNAAIEKFESLKEKYTKSINALRTRIQTLEADIAKTDKEIASKTTLVEGFKAKLIPLFDELKNFYAKRGIKGVKGL